MNIRLFLMVLVFLIFTSYVFSEKLCVLAELTNPSIIEIDGDDLFVLDDVEVYVYSLKNQQFLRKFGKKGEGPGELLPVTDLPIMMYVNSEYVLLNSFNKIVYFSKEGKMIKEQRIPFITFQIIPFGNNFAITKFTRNNEGGSQISVWLLNREFKKLKTLYDTELLNDMRKKKIALPFVNSYIRCSDNQLYVVDQKKEFEVLRFDLEGNRLPQIKHPYPKIKVTEAYKKETWEWLQLEPAFKAAPESVKQMIYFLEYLPVIRNLLAKDKKIYVQTYKTKDRLSEFFILDLNGRLLKTVFLPGADKRGGVRPTPAVTYAFKDDEYYYLEENIDDEEWELHRITPLPSPSS